MYTGIYDITGTRLGLSEVVRRAQLVRRAASPTQHSTATGGRPPPAPDARPVFPGELTRRRAGRRRCQPRYAGEREEPRSRTKAPPTADRRPTAKITGRKCEKMAMVWKVVISESMRSLAGLCQKSGRLSVK